SPDAQLLIDFKKGSKLSRQERLIQELSRQERLIQERLIQELSRQERKING
ncbi:hypothetical protein Tco_1048768, partial [Tanacetum coccineum]